MPKNPSKILQCSRRFSSFIFVKADFARLREVAKYSKRRFRSTLNRRQIGKTSIDKIRILQYRKSA